GLMGFAKALAREVASRGITVNVVAPGLIETDMTKAMAEKAQASWAEQIPLARLGTVDDVAAAVCFLASDEASYITGHVLAVNGGMYMEGDAVAVADTVKRLIGEQLGGDGGGVTPDASSVDELGADSLDTV